MFKYKQAREIEQESGTYVQILVTKDTHSKLLKIMAPSFLTFFDQSKFQAATAFSSILWVHTLC